MDSEYEKVRVYNKDKKKDKKPVDTAEVKHPRHPPYKRGNKGMLHHSLVIDGLGEDFVDDEERT